MRRIARAAQLTSARRPAKPSTSPTSRQRKDNDIPTSSNLTGHEASYAAVTRVVASTGTVRSPTLQAALDKLTAIAAMADEPDALPPSVGLVVINGGGTPDVVCGSVALVDFSELQEPCYSAGAIEEIADLLARDLGDHATHTVADLRDLAHTRRVEHLEDDGRIDACPLPQLQAAVAASNLAPEQITIAGAQVTSHRSGT